MSQTFTPQSLLQTQRSPFVLVDASLRIQDMNQALQTALGVSAADSMGKACCALDAEASADCRHRRFFNDLEPYVETSILRAGDGQLLNARVQGFPLMDAQGKIYLGESIHPISDTAPQTGMVGRSEAFKDLQRQLLQAASTQAPVLLNGETGVGKELAAQYLHRHSSRSQGPFVVVDCTVLSEDLFESELFGHVKGAFTGATSNKTGLFELADGGTLFLDEVGELPVSQQPKLLRALESGGFRPLGSTQPKRSDVRIVSATHQDLGGMIQTGAFRQDLYYRLAVLPLRLPALRERREDIPSIAEHLLQEIAQQSKRNLRLQRDAFVKLLRYGFPGNIRELRNILHLGATLCQNGIIRSDDIPLLQASNTPQPTHPATAMNPAQPMAGAELSPLETAEAGYILGLVQKHNGSRKRVAAEMNVSERTLYRKLKHYGLNKAS